MVGSSLTVWSGFRFVERAAARGIPIAIVNIGPTLGDELATVKVDAECGEVLRVRRPSLPRILPNATIGVAASRT